MMRRLSSGPFLNRSYVCNFAMPITDETSVRCSPVTLGGKFHIIGWGSRQAVLVVYPAGITECRCCIVLNTALSSALTR